MLAQTIHWLLLKLALNAKRRNTEWLTPPETTTHPCPTPLPRIGRCLWPHLNNPLYNICPRNTGLFLRSARSKIGVLLSGRLCFDHPDESSTGFIAATSSVYYTPISSTGTVGIWSTATKLPSAISKHSAVVSNGYVYTTGGFDGTNPTSTVLNA